MRVFSRLSVEFGFTMSYKILMTLSRQRILFGISELGLIPMYEIQIERVVSSKHNEIRDVIKKQGKNFSANDEVYTL